MLVDRGVDASEIANCEASQRVICLVKTLHHSEARVLFLDESMVYRYVDQRHFDKHDANTSGPAAVPVQQSYVRTPDLHQGRPIVEAPS